MRQRLQVWVVLPGNGVERQDGGREGTIVDGIAVRVRVYVVTVGIFRAIMTILLAITQTTQWQTLKPLQQQQQQ